MEHATTSTLHGLMAEFDSPTALVDAATKARLAGYRKMDAYSPIPIHELDEALGLKRTRLPLLVLIGGILGCIGGFGLASWVSAIAYPLNVGMWLERFIIIVTSLHRDFLPSSWDMYAPTRWDFGMFTGTIGLFLSLFFLFVRLLPAISIFEVRTLVPEAKLKGVSGAEHSL